MLFPIPPRYTKKDVLFLKELIEAGKYRAVVDGALHAIARQPGGTVVLWLQAVGFAGMALWRLAEAAYGQAGPGGRTAPKRPSQAMPGRAGRASVSA